MIQQHDPGAPLPSGRSRSVSGGENEIAADVLEVLAELSARGLLVWTG